MLQGKKILLGITGSIAAYKSITLVRLLVKRGASVKVILTPAAKDFVSPLTLSTLSKEPVLCELFAENSWANHVELGRWADLFLIAPASCNTIAKMAHGMCDNLLMASYLSSTCPVWVAPAMDEDMWHHPTTKNNLDLLRSFGNRVVPVNAGELASGLFGEGRMAEPEQLVEDMEVFFKPSSALAGKSVLITAGPTYEPIDPVRFIGNHSSGKMGVALALELAARGASVDLVAGPGVQTPIHQNIRVHAVRTAHEMYERCSTIFPHANLAIMAAAVADYTPTVVAEQKIKKQDGGIDLQLTKTRDILKSLGAEKRPDQVLVGFALETNNERDNAIQKLNSKNADLIVLNSLQDPGAGFGVDTNKITIFDRNGNEYAFETKSKADVAVDIIDTIQSSFYE